jgi:diguanylate cyclase (GGDEF)-like protein
MPADPPTLFVVVVVSTFAGTLLLVWCWLQNRAEQSLLWIACAYAVGSVSTFLFAGRGLFPDRLSIDVATAIAMFGVGLAWNCGRSFNGRPAPLWVPLAGPLLWFVACQFPGFYDVFSYRIALAAAMSSLYGLLAAAEFWKHDGLRGRYPVAIVLAFHAVATSLRVPIALSEMAAATQAYRSVWFGPVALESIVFVQVIGVLLVSLTKERLEARLRDAARTDALTGLANRRALLERGVAVVAEAARRGRPTAVIAFDLDRFKEVNDRFGHPVGDAVLQAFAAAAVATLRAGDIAGRLGGEEFAVVLPETAAAEAATVAERLMAAFRERAAAVEGCAGGCTTSAGIAASLHSVLPIETLLASADRALYAAKREGGDRVRFAAVAEVAA